MKYAWIEAQLDSYPVRRMCELLGVSASGFLRRDRGLRRPARPNRLGSWRRFVVLRRAIGAAMVVGE